MSAAGGSATCRYSYTIFLKNPKTALNRRKTLHILLLQKTRLFPCNYTALHVPFLACRLCVLGQELIPIPSRE